MSSYDERSRYRDVPVYQVPDRRGRPVTVVAVPAHPEQAVAGVHLLRQGQRPDHLAAQYLDNPAGFWRIAEANDAMQAEWLSERPEITIPVRAV
jgi:hypothetical protein